MLDRLLGAFARLTPVHVARTEEERAAVYRMRYSVYFGEKNEVGVPHVDHARREIRTPEDDLPETTLFYTGTPPNLETSMRLRTWAPGEIPSDFRERYSLDRFPDLDTRTVCNVGFLMTLPTLRGKGAMVALTSGAVEWAVVHRGVELLVSDCAPGLLRPYRRLGLRPFGARVLSTHRGMQIPVAGVTADLEHVRRVGSPWYPVLRKLGDQGRLPARDFSGLLAPFAREGVESDPARVLAAIEGSAARHASPFLEALPEGVRRRLARECVIFDVDPGVDMLVEGFANRDVFVVLEGELALLLGGATVATLGPGEVLGEVAYFRGIGQRSATVRSTSRSSVLHLRNGVLRRLAAEHPRDALAVYESLARVLADRLAAWGRDGRRPTGAIDDGPGATA